MTLQELDILYIVQNLQKIRASLQAIIGEDKNLIDSAKKIYAKSIELQELEEQDVVRSEYEKFLFREYRQTFQDVNYESIDIEESPRVESFEILHIDEI